MSTTPRPRLDQDRIVDAAITLADADGLDAASTRRVAEALDVTPMALYRHVTNREALLDAMVDRVVAAIAPTVADGPWQRVLRERILAARAALRRHPWTQGAIESRTIATPTVLAHMDALMAIMFAGGLSADLVHHAMHALGTRMWGFTRDVLPMPPLPAGAERELALAAFASRFPAIAQMATTASGAGDGCDSDAEFAFALDLLIDGIDRLHTAGWQPGGGWPGNHSAH